MSFKPLPIGVDDFEKVITGGYYYVDKTLFLKELLDRKGEVNLFTRPRRFGKTLCVSMLQCFFEDTGSREKNGKRRDLFRGLSIMEQGERYTGSMGKYPVISLSLKSGKQSSFQYAFGCLREVIAAEFSRHREVKASLESDADRKRYEEIEERRADMQNYLTALAFLSRCLYSHYGKPVIILIDEYDVPLENAHFCGFYSEMAGFIRSFFESALKSNPCLEFAVITGCLRVTKESIFTGLNNLKTISILNGLYSEHFGFEQAEVDRMLGFYGLEDKRNLMKEWYDGYLFGSAEVYNPWSVINFVEALHKDPEVFPTPYWANTSSNDIVKSLVEHSDLAVKGELETLIAGGTIEKPVHEEITYSDIDKSDDNLWNFLFFTGYLKQISQRMEGENRYITMAIPNQEVRYIYRNTVLSWFDSANRGKDFSRLYTAMETGAVAVMSEIISENLQESISFFDYGESYYHGFLAGLLKNAKNYRLLSNRESGNGRPDLLLKTPGVRGMAIVMELKTVKKYSQMEAGCREALEQIARQNYKKELTEEGYAHIVQYGLCFYQKECLVMKMEEGQ